MASQRVRWSSDKAPEGEAPAAGDAKDKKKDESRPKPVHAQPEGEYDGPKGPEPTRYGDWERKGRCSDF